MTYVILRPVGFKCRRRRVSGMLYIYPQSLDDDTVLVQTFTVDEIQE